MFRSATPKLERSVDGDGYAEFYRPVAERLTDELTVVTYRSGVCGYSAIVGSTTRVPSTIIPRKDTTSSVHVTPCASCTGTPTNPS